MENEKQGNIGDFLKTMPRTAQSERAKLPYVGVDECLNSSVVDELLRSLMQKGLVDSAGSLWYETRTTDDGIKLSVPGGIRKNSWLRTPNPLVADIGRRDEHSSWNDFSVTQALVVEFISYDQVVLLSENILNNEGGLRRILNTIVAPVLEVHPDILSLVALFKKGKTNIADYCQKVTETLESNHFERGYSELLL